MAHKKAGGSSRNGRDTAGRRLGVKKFGGEFVVPGNIIVRQRGTKWRVGTNVGLGRDHTIFALVAGRVAFKTKDGGRTYVSVEPLAEARRIAGADRAGVPPTRCQRSKGEAGQPLPLFVAGLRHAMPAEVVAEDVLTTRAARARRRCAPAHAPALFPLLNDWDVVRMLAEVPWPLTLARRRGACRAAAAADARERGLRRPARGRGRSASAA